MRKIWTAPDRFLLRIRELQPEVRPIYDPGAPSARRKEAREITLAFLHAHHYLHQAPDGKAPNFTWSFGLYLHQRE